MWEHFERFDNGVGDVIIDYVPQKYPYAIMTSFLCNTLLNMTSFHHTEYDVIFAFTMACSTIETPNLCHKVGFIIVAGEHSSPIR